MPEIVTMEKTEFLNKEITEKTEQIMEIMSKILTFCSKVSDIDNDVDKSQLMRTLIKSCSEICNCYFSDNIAHFTSYNEKTKRFLRLDDMKIFRKFSGERFDSIIVRIPMYVAVESNGMLNSYVDEATITFKCDTETGKFTEEKIEFLSQNCANVNGNIHLPNAPVYQQEEWSETTIKPGVVIVI